MPQLARLALVFALAAVPAWAQGSLSFEATAHGFGEVVEGERPTHVFRFVNVGDAPVRLTQVRPACGCTTPSYTTDPVAPGETGMIEVAYDSKGRPGAFNKTIAVTTDSAEPRSYQLRIVGTVVRPTLDAAASVAQGAVRFESDHHAAELTGEGLAHAFKLQNTGRRPVRFKAARSVPEGAVIGLPEKPVFAGEMAEIAVTIPAEMMGAQGADVAIIVETDDAEQPVKSLRVVASPAGTPQ